MRSKEMWFGLLTACRPHQWLEKNIVVLFPLLFLSAHQWGEESVKLIAVFGLLCLSAGSVYLINDSIDRDRDRQHPTKCNRPIAAGHISVRLAICTAIAFMVIAFMGALLIGSYPLAGVIGLYLAVSTVYTFILKHVPVLDVVGLGGLYAIRLLVGFTTISVFPTGWVWMLLVVWGAAIGLALSKRWAEAYNVTAGSRKTLTFYRSKKTSVMFYASSGGAIPFYLFGAAPPYLPEVVVIVTSLVGAYLMHRYWCEVVTLTEDLHPQTVIKRVIKQEITVWTSMVSRAVATVSTLSLRQ